MDSEELANAHYIKMFLKYNKPKVIIFFMSGLILIFAGYFLTKAQNAFTQNVIYYAPYTELSGTQSVVYYYLGLEKPAQDQEILQLRTTSTETYYFGRGKYAQVAFAMPQQTLINGKWIGLLSATTTLKSFNTNIFPFLSWLFPRAWALSDTRSGAAFTSYPATGCPAWGTPNNAKFSDNVYTSVVLNLASSCYLRSLFWGFTIPQIATIDGVEIVVEKKRVNLSGGIIQDDNITLFPVNVPAGDQEAGTANWPTADATFTYGRPTSKWGLALTPAIINAAGFGSGVKAKEITGNGGDRASIDQVKMTTYYSLPMTFLERHYYDKTLFDIFNDII